MADAMIVVSDTSPITSLLQTRHDGLLPVLFKEVLAPQAVHAELLRFHSTLPAWLHVRQVVDYKQTAQLRTLLDAGEAEAIVLAQERGADYLLIDEKIGREQAEMLGLKAIGLLGVLLLAKRSGHLQSVAAVIDELASVAGFFVSERVKSIVLEAAGETP